MNTYSESEIVMQTAENISFLVQEYQSIVEDSSRESLKNRLVEEADWTDQGAEELIYLAKRYGSFVLRNALALSIALEIEDGEARM